MILTPSAHRILDHWFSGSRDAVLMHRAMEYTESVIEVLLERGYLTIEGVQVARAEIGPLSDESLERMRDEQLG